MLLSLPWCIFSSLYPLNTHTHTQTQTLSLSLSVILCQPQPDEGHAFKGIPKGMNLVVVEGGPKGIKKFVSLMLKRYTPDDLYFAF